MKHLAAFAIATTLAAPAFAGGMTTPVEEPMLAPVAAPVYSGGDWTGLYAGAQLGYGDVDSNGAGLDGNGAIGGVHMGYRNDFGTLVAGAELDYNVSNIDLGATGSLDNIARLKLMAGYDLGQALIYGTAGAAHASANDGVSDLSDTGYFYGIGADYALGGNWVLGGEVLQHKFDNFDNSGVDVDATTAQVRVSLRF